MESFLILASLVLACAVAVPVDVPILNVTGTRVQPTPFPDNSLYWQYYTAVENDTIFSISQKFQLDQYVICQYNFHKTENHDLDMCANLTVGTELIIPSGALNPYRCIPSANFFCALAGSDFSDLGDASIKYSMPVGSIVNANRFLFDDMLSLPSGIMLRIPIFSCLPSLETASVTPPKKPFFKQILLNYWGLIGTRFAIITTTVWIASLAK